MEKINVETKQKIIDLFEFIDKKKFARKYDFQYDSLYRAVTGQKEITTTYYKRLKEAVEDWKKNFVDTI